MGVRKPSEPVEAPSPPAPTTTPTSTTEKPQEEGVLRQYVTQQTDGRWLAMCDRDDCNWQKLYPNQMAANMGFQRHRGTHKPKSTREEKLGEESRPPAPDLSKMAPREVVAYYGQEGLETLKRERLFEFLKIAPGVGEKIAEWVMKQWDTDTSIRRSSNALYQVLTSSGLRQEMAYRIANMLYTMEQEYQDILNRQQQFIPGQAGPQQAGPTPFWPEPSRQQPPQPQLLWNPYSGRYEYSVQPPQGGQPSQPPYPFPFYYGEPPRRRRGEEAEEGLTREEAANLIKDALREDREKSRLDKLEQAMVGVGNTLDQLEKRLEAGEFSRRRGEEEESPITKDLKDRLTRMETRERDLTESIHKAERALDQKEAEHLKDELKRTQTEISGLRTEIQLAAGSKTVEGYKEDSMRVVGQGMQTMAQVAQSRRPAETIAGYIFGAPPGAPTPPPPESTGGLASRLPQRFVTRVQ